MTFSGLALIDVTQSQPNIVDRLWIRFNIQLLSWFGHNYFSTGENYNDDDGGGDDDDGSGGDGDGGGVSDDERDDDDDNDGDDGSGGSCSGGDANYVEFSSIDFGCLFVL